MVDNICPTCQGTKEEWRRRFSKGLGFSPSRGAQVALLPNLWSKDWTVAVECFDLLFRPEGIYLSGTPSLTFDETLGTRQDVKRMALRFIEAFDLQPTLPERVAPLELHKLRGPEPLKAGRVWVEVPVIIKKGQRTAGYVEAGVSDQQVRFQLDGEWVTVPLYSDATHLRAGFMSLEYGEPVVDLRHPTYASVIG